MINREIKIKICGITCDEDIIFLNRYHPDYAGFIFAESRRLLTPEKAADLVGRLDSSIKKVGVFVNAPIRVVAETVAIVGLDVVQLHGDETGEYLHELRQRLNLPNLNRTNDVIEIWKGIRVRDESSLRLLDAINPDRYLLDSWGDSSYGGSGKSFDWNLLEGGGNDTWHRLADRLVLAGGLNPGNVNEATRRIRPFAVDVSSGVETEGRKDEFRIRDFIYQVRKTAT
jgi:phosphoribosylanthranilate isomerase